ncbi:MAG: hypothetical protein Q9214_004133 [Letrouitia sp. 1 TL-2023]
MAGLASFKEDYIEGEFKQMLEMLGVAHLRNHVEPHEATKTYCDWMMKHAELDSFFEFNFIQAPCTYGWSKLAQDIYHNKNFKREGLFFETFIKPNVTDWLEFEKKERDSNGKVISTIVKVPQEGGWSSYAVETAESPYADSYSCAQAFANTRMKPSHWTRELGIKLIKQGLEHECALFKAAYQLADRKFAAQKLDEA